MSESETRLIERQQRWEVNAVTTGVARYRNNTRKAVEGGLLSDTKPGMRMMTAIIPSLVEAINAARVEAQKGFGGGARNVTHWWMPILSLSAEKLAYICLRTAMGNTDDNEVRTVARKIGQRCEMERQFEIFKETETAREKSMIQEGHERPENVYKLMCQYASEVNPRTFKRWKQKVADFDVTTWGEEISTSLGMKIIFLMVEHGGGWFQVRTAKERTSRIGFKTRKMLEMTPEAQAFLGDQRSLDEVNRPWLVPMLSKPVRWEANT